MTPHPTGFESLKVDRENYSTNIVRDNLVKLAVLVIVTIARSQGDPSLYNSL